MKKIVARNGITGLFAGKFFPIFKKIQTREFLIIDVYMHKLYISISVNTVSYAIVCRYKARHADFGLSWDLLGRVPWDKAQEGREAKESCLILKNHLLQAQEQCIPAKRKSGENSIRPVWRKKELLDKLIHSKEGSRGWKQGQVIITCHRETVQADRDQVMARAVKGNMKSFYRYVGDQRKTRENLGPLLHDSGSLRRK